MLYNILVNEKSNKYNLEFFNPNPSDTLIHIWISCSLDMANLLIAVRRHLYIHKNINVVSIQ